jgi:SAM-dependent methyltransferase
MTASPGAVRFVEDAFRIILGRRADPVELRDAARGFHDGARHVLRLRLLSSPEFLRIRRAWTDGASPWADPAAVERELEAVGPAETFVERVYECLLGRPADQDGRRHYTAAITAGERRTGILSALGRSEEFDRHHRALAPQSGLLPRDTQLCELANPAKWDNDQWLAILRSFGLSDDKLSMHRKPYEFTQLVFGCRELGALRNDSRVISVGAGHELVLYWLANRVRQVIATDMYEGHWQEAQGREGDPDVLSRPEDYAPFPYRRQCLTFLRMDGRALAFREGTFDIAYSLSSIEHFGGLPGAQAAVREMARVLRRGGVLALATEYVVEGPPHDETFQPAEFEALIDLPDLELVQPLDTAVYRRYTCSPIDLHLNPYQAPHMVVRFGDTIFTTAMVFLRKR